jgi:chromate transporter
MNEPSSQAAIPHASLGAIAWAFFQIGALGFGGALVGWVYREMVEKRGWQTPDDFASMVTLGQVMPGVNITNYAVYVGHRLQGAKGSAVALLAILAGPFLWAIAFMVLFAQIQDIHWVHALMGGVAVAAVGLMFSAIVKTLRRSVRTIPHLLIYATLVVGIGILNWPMVPVVLIAIPLSVAIAWFTRERRNG